MSLLGVARPKLSRDLKSGIIRAARATNAVKPFARDGQVSVPSFFDGWLVSELPLHVAAASTLATLRMVRRGALKTWSGRAAIALNTVSSLRLLQIHRNASGAGDVLHDALVDELGADFATRVDPALQYPSVAFPMTRLIQPLPTTRRGLLAEENISYGEHGRRNRLDVWRSPDLPNDAKAPVLLQVHGGAWMIGNKEQQAMPLMTQLAQHGWVCVTINYRLSPRATWPDHIVDVKRAIAWTKANIERFGGDPNFIAITGGSAGGHLSSLAALTPNDARFQPGFEDVDTTVQAAVPIYGVYDFTNRDQTGRGDMKAMLQDRVFKTKLADDRDAWEAASTMSHVHAVAPPFFVIHGTNDSLVPVEQARSFATMLRKESSQSVVFAELPGAQHAFDVFWSPRTHATVHAIEQFLNVVRTEAGQLAR